MSDNPSVADPFGRIADEFVAEFRLGRRPSVDEYARRYPEFADDIKDMVQCTSGDQWAARDAFLKAATKVFPNK